MDGNLANVWVYYEFYAGDKFSHCGVDNFQLGRTDAGWKIILLADSRRRQGCSHVAGQVVTGAARRAALALLAAAALAPHPLAAQGPPPGWPALTGQFDAYVKSDQIVGATLAWVRDGRIVARHHVGPGRPGQRPGGR